MGKFEPKKYLNNEIKEENCGHELLSTSGFDEGMYGTTYNCLICGSRIYYGIYDHQDIEDKYIFQDYGCLTPNNIELIKNMIVYISTRYVNEESINIAGIFNEIAPYLDEIATRLNILTEIDTKTKKDKYQKVLQRKK